MDFKGARIIRPQQIEFARLNISYMVMSKRKLLELVEETTYLDGMIQDFLRLVECVEEVIQLMLFVICAAK